MRILLFALVLLTGGLCPLTPRQHVQPQAAAPASDAEFAMLHARASLALEHLRQSHE